MWTVACSLRILRHYFLPAVVRSNSRVKLADAPVFCVEDALLSRFSAAAPQMSRLESHPTFLGDDIISSSRLYIDLANIAKFALHVSSWSSIASEQLQYRAQALMADADPPSLRPTSGSALAARRGTSFRRIKSLFDEPTRDELYIEVLREKLASAERRFEEVAVRNTYLALKVKHLMKVGSNNNNNDNDNDGPDNIST